MKVRYTINAHGELEDRDGNVLGRVTALTIDTANRGTIGGGFSFSEQQEGKEEKNPLTPEIREVWEHYDALIGKGRRQLKTQQIRDIQRALKVRELEQVKAAVTGLANSPHHNGQNETGTKYLDIRYALRGNSQRGETHEERIDRMAEITASLPAPTNATRDRGVHEGLISSLKADIRRCWRRDDRHGQPSEEELQRRAEAIQRLYGFGIMVRLDDAGKPTYEDIA